MSKAQREINSKIGPMFLVASAEVLYGIFWKDQKIEKEKLNSRESKMLDKVERQITEYLDGKRKDFDIPLELEGTAFQKQVWAQLCKIPYGETRSYKDIAKKLKDTNASRAVGTANGKNPISLIVPCHRVIASNGTLAGYAGGISIKEKLLSLEKGQKLK